MKKLFFAYCFLVCSMIGVQAQSQELVRQEIPLASARTMGRDTFDFKGKSLINGRIFSNAVGAQINAGSKLSVTYVNDGYSLFEAFIGMDYDDTKNRKLTTRFSVWGDGRELFWGRTTSGEDALKISVPLGEASAITLKVENADEDGRVKVYWAEGVWVKFVAAAPPESLISSATGAPALPDNAVANAAETEKMVVSLYSNGSANIAINDRTIEFGSTRPLTINGRLLVPLRPLLEALGASVRFDAETANIVASRSDTQLQMQINSFQASVNGAAVAIDQPPKIINGSAYAPLRFVSDALGAQVSVRDFR